MHLARKLALLLSSTVVGLLLVEGLFRVWLAFASTPADSSYIPDPHCGYRLRPDSDAVRRAHPDDSINSFGFRDVEHPVRKPPHTWRVLGLGDSFVYGAVPLHDNFLRVAERRLAGLSAPDSSRPEMVMMGIGAYSPENELGVLQSIGLDLAPDAVVLCFFVGNDVTGIPLRGKVLRGQLYFTGAMSPVHDILRRSYAYMVTEMFVTMRLKWPLQKALAARRARSAAPPEPAGAAIASAPYPPVNSIFLEFESRRLPVYLRQPGSRLRNLWQEAEASLAAFDSTCKAAGVPWVLLAIPEEVQVDPDVRAAVLSSLHQSESIYDFELPQRRLRDFAAAHRVPMLDPLSRMRAEHRADARLYIPNDTHWNERGNRIAGEMLAEFLATLRAPAQPANVLATRPGKP